MSSPIGRRQALRRLAAVIGVACFGNSTAGQTVERAAPSVVETEVLFFNTHLLPPVAQVVAGHRGQDELRIAALAARLPRYDIVGLCEVFQRSRRRELVRQLHEDQQAPFHWVESPNPTGRHLVDGGLLLLSRYPIEGDAHVLTFRDASRVYNTGLKADGLAAKGAIHARLLLCAEPRVLLDVFLTHLESISAPARQAQIGELADFIARHRDATRPALLMGDLNVPAPGPTLAGHAPEHAQLVAALHGADSALVDVWPQLRADQGGTRDALAAGQCDRIDYLFAATRMTDQGTLFHPVDVRIAPFLDPRVRQGSLSDHAGVAARLQSIVGR